MVYTLAGVKRGTSGNILKYKVRRVSDGVEQFLSSYQVKQLMTAGNEVYGCRLKNNRLYLEDKSNTQEIKESRFYTAKNTVSEFFDIKSGNKLENWIKDHRALTFKPRYMVDNIVNDCISTDYRHIGKLVIIHGIRRSGKTVAIIQSIHKLISAGIRSQDIAYINVIEKTNEDIYQDANKLYDLIESMNQKYIFVDEVTRLIGITSCMANMADMLTSTKRIVLTGTDNYVFPVSFNTSLFDRALIHRSTMIPYNEYIYLYEEKFRDKDNNYKINSYMKNGGSLIDSEFNSQYNSCITLKATIADNIARTINKNGDMCRRDLSLRGVADLTVDELLYGIYYLVVISTFPKSGDNAYTDRRRINNKVKQLLYNISNATPVNNFESVKVPNISKQGMSALSIALRELNIIDYITNFVPEETINKAKQNTKIEYICMIQSLACTMIGETFGYKTDTLGQIFENMILSQLIYYVRTYTNGTIGYARYNLDNTSYEVDAIVRLSDMNKYSCYAIEIKYSDKINRKFIKNLVAKSLQDSIEFNVTDRIIIYRGETQKLGGIQYINAHDFLMDIGKWIN